jgi:hypothetical protein
MQTLITLLKPFLLIVAQRVGPDVLPRSGFLLGLVIVTHMTVYYLGLLALDTSPQRTFAMPLLDTVTQYAFFSILVIGAGLRERLVQTLTAVFGADVVLNLIALPLAMVPVSDPPELTFPVLASIIVLLWSLGVKGHILNRALGLPYFVGVLISAGFLIAFLSLNSAIFGASA